MNWNDFAKEVHQVAVDHGWWDKPVSFDDVVCMCICELAEAVEEWRDGQPMVYCKAMNQNDACKKEPCAGIECLRNFPERRPEGVAVELADCVLRLLDYLATSKEGPILPIEPIVPSGDFQKVICDLHGQLAEARNCERAGVHYSAEGHLHLCIELICGWAAREGIDLEAILRAKHEYNKTRPFRHGGKRL